MRRYSFIGSFFIFNLIFLSIKTSIAQNGEYAGYVPSELKSWERWVKESDSNYTCARMEISRNCFWQGDLTINVVDSGAEFISKVVLDKEGYVSLPGGNDIWPIDVKAESNSIRQVPIVLTGEDVQRISGSSSPMAYLPAGQWTITGMFSWKIKPATIVVPQGVGLLNLTIDGARVLNPKVEDNGTLWIGETKQDAKSDLNPDVKQDYVSLVVLRKFEDGVPIKLETRLKLSVSGKERTIDLGRVLPVGFSIVRVDSSLPYQLSSEDKLVVQVGAGRHEIVLHGYSLISLDKIQAPQNTALLWPEQETWVWVGNESYRAVQVEGVTATDPSRTEIPSAWRRFPTYQIPNKTVMTLKELRRGETSLSPNEILVNRTLWLSESGESFIARDRLNGMLYKSFRLNANERNDLGSIQQNGQNLLITLDPTTNKKGVELRGQLVGLIGISEIKDPYKSMTAVGWEEDAKSLSMKLMLPPGWKLFHASGVNKLQNSWFGSWTPWDIFIVLLMALATFKVLGAGAGVLAAFVLVIIHGELSNSFFIWILLIATVALMRALPEGRVKVVLKYIDIVLKVCLAFILVGFCLNQIKDLIYPQLALEGSVTASAMHFLGASGVINFFGFFGFILFVFFGIWYFVLLFRRAWAKAFLTLGGLILFVSVGVGINRAYVGRGIHGMAKPPSSAMESTGDYSRYDMKDRKTSKSFISDPYQEQQSINVITPKSNEFLQTGPALPQWRHRVYSFFWNYSVSKDHEIRFYLISPAMNCVLSIIRIVLVVLLGYCFIRPRRLSMPRNAMLVFLCALIFCPNIVLAENYPSRELLDDLKQRMARNECHNDCVKAQNLDVNISDNNARFVVDVHSHGINAYAIPGPAREFRPERIKLDGVDYNAVIKRDDGFIWVRIPSGIHRIEFERNLSGLNMLELEFVDVPGQVKIQSNEWYQEGINENNSLITKALRLIRQENIKKNINNASEKIESVFALGSWFTVRRKIDFGVQWRIVNIAEREGLVDRAESVAIDLLDGEEVSNRDVRVEKNKAIVSFPVGVKRVEWNSLLKEKEQIFLFANNVERLSEKWEIFCSALYQCEYRGISPTTSIENGKSIRS